MVEKDNKNLGRRMGVSSLWSVGQRWAMRVLSIISTIITAKLLTPEDFGVMALALMVFEILNSITSFGIEASVIRNKDAREEHYHTAWTMTILRGLLIAIVLAVSAYPLSAFFNDIRLAPLFLAIAAYAVLGGFRNIGAVNFRKDLQFEKEFRLTFVKRIVGFVVLISAAYLMRSYWAFVISTATIVVVDLVATYAMSPFRPRLSLATWREQLSFSKWALARDVVEAVGNRIDVAVLGAFSTKTIVGGYRLAYDISSMPGTELAMPLSASLMPGLARIIDDRKEVRRLTTMFLAFTYLIVVPLGLGVALTASQLVPLLLGAKWIFIIPYMQILSINSIFASIGASRVASLMASGEIAKLTYQSVILKLIRFIGVVAGFGADGAIGLIWGILVASVINTAITLYWQSKSGYMYFLPLWAKTWRIFLSAVFMAGAVLFVDNFALEGLPVVAVLMSKVAVGCLAYLAGVVGLWFVFGRPAGPEKQLIHLLKSTLMARLGR